jgi:hypothetical protein
MIIDPLARGGATSFLLAASNEQIREEVPASENLAEPVVPFVIMSNH